MTHEQQINYSGSRWGRVRLHARALLRDGKLFWHLRGILRELMTP